MQFKFTKEFRESQGLCEDFEERFWKRVFVIPYDRGCWIWTGGLSYGYGYMKRNGALSKSIRAHVASWIIHNGPTNGLHVCHKCDNPPCVNPNHLFIGTNADNIRDCVSKNRNKNPVFHGIDHFNHKLIEQEVVFIRMIYKNGDGEMLGRRFRVVAGTILAIVNRKIWKHI